MWIDTAGTLPAGSQLTRAVIRPITMPRSHRFMLHSLRPTNWSRSASPFKTPPRSQVYTFSTPGSSARPSNLSRDF
ncbi:hypothetical protein BASA50_010694 [Batrachochytrium salamandrivorans]|uniref:Uncharacterized protein n=1 Tax=Batrachochytrium salamandrivorans TaxID=1357716 RepID=A0ABQ8EYZ1_9FUNG|nr:hypothetical protein BASA50_010694 [Batrachochytrium salamandrivorans]